MKGNNDHLAVGVRGEEIAQQYLADQGFTIDDTNVSNKLGEIDIIARRTIDGIVRIHFVEVKTVRAEYRTNEDGESYRPIDNLTPHKIQKLHRTIEFHNQSHNPQEYPWQLDAVLVYLGPDGSRPVVRYLEHISTTW